MTEESNGNRKLAQWLPTLVMLFIYIISFSTLWGALNARVDATETYLRGSNENLAALMVSINDIKTQLAVISNTGTIKAIENSAEIKDIQKDLQDLRNRILTLELAR